MADISQTAANVKIGAGAVAALERCGEAVTQGMPLYLSDSDGKWYKADANEATKYNAKGIAITPGGIDGYILIAKSGLVNLGATLTKAEVYVVSANAGAIAPVADVTTNWYPSIVGVSESTDGWVRLVLQAGTEKRPA